MISENKSLSYRDVVKMVGISTSIYCKWRKECNYHGYLKLGDICALVEWVISRNKRNATVSKKKQSESMKARWGNPEYKKRLSDIKKKSWKDPAKREKFMSTLHSPETIEKRRKTILAYYAIPENKSAHTAAIKEGWRKAKLLKKKRCIYGHVDGDCLTPNIVRMAEKIYSIFPYLKQNLTDRESQIIIMRFGLDDGTPKSLGSVGVKFGICRERVNQIESIVILKAVEGGLIAENDILFVGEHLRGRKVLLNSKHQLNKLNEEAKSKRIIGRKRGRYKRTTIVNNNWNSCRLTTVLS